MILIISGICAKYLICQDFVKNLDFKNDEILKVNGGVNKWVIILAIILAILIYLPLIIALLFYGSIFTTGILGILLP